MLADRTTLLPRLTAKSFLAFGMRNAMTAKPGTRRSAVITHSNACIKELFIRFRARTFRGVALC